MGHPSPGWGIPTYPLGVTNILSKRLYYLVAAAAGGYLHTPQQGDPIDTYIGKNPNPARGGAGVETLADKFDSEVLKRHRLSGPHYRQDHSVLDDEV